MRKKDYILIVCLWICVGIGFFLFYIYNMNDDAFVDVYYQKNMIDRIDIHKNQIYCYQGSYGKFYIEVKDKKYRAVHVECPNHNCEKIGWVKEGNIQPIICLPNEIYIVQFE